VLGALGALGVLVGRSRLVLIGGFVAVAAAEVLLGRDLAPHRLGSALASASGLAAVVMGLAVIGVLAAVLVRYPAAVPPAVVALAPFRLPFDVGSDKRFFIGLGEGGALGRLVPLYVTLAAAAAALVWRLLRGEQPKALPLTLAVAAGGLVGLMSLSLLWAHDSAASTNRLAFFVLPFAVLLAVVAHSPFRPWLTRVLGIEAVALGCLFAAVGIGEAWTHRLLFYEPKLAVANSYTSYFRVTSFFADPSIYARHLVLALMVLVVAVLLARINVVLCAALMALIWVGLYFSYSQSSMVALAASTILVTTLAGGRRTRRVMAAAVAGVVILGAVAFVTLVRDHSVNRVVSGRWTLVQDTWAVFGNHPLEGVGVASQPAASRDETGGRSKRRTTSHTAPLTVAAELGIFGIFFYVAFLAAAAQLFWRLRPFDEALGLGLLGVLTVLVVHSFSYGVFFEDPLLWAALGVGAAATLAYDPATGLEA
jgi:hypothetical protein